MNKLQKTAIISSIATAGIAILKFFVGTLSGSLALIADSMHSFTDLIGSIAVFLGVSFSEKKTKNFPYGLYKIENLISLFLSLLIFYTAFEIIMEAIEVMSALPQQANTVTIIATVISLFVSSILAKYKLKIGKEENSPSMLSEGKHTKLDAITTAGVLFAVVASYIGFPIFDSIIGFFIALIVFKAGVEIFIDSSKVLLDASLDYGTMKKIEGIAEKEKEIRVSSLRARSSGRYVFVDMSLETNIKELKKANKLRENIEKKIRESIPKIDKIMIDFEYKKKDILTYAVPLEKKDEISKLALDFGSAKYFGLFSLKNDNSKALICKKVITNPHYNAESRRGILLAEMLIKKKVDVIITKKPMHKGGAFYALQDNFIEMKQINAINFKNTLKEVMEEKI